MILFNYLRNMEFEISGHVDGGEPLYYNKRMDNQKEDIVIFI